MSVPEGAVYKVLNALVVVGSLDEREIVRATGLDPDVVATMLVELKERGWIEAAGRRLGVE